MDTIQTKRLSLNQFVLLMAVLAAMFVYAATVTLKPHSSVSSVSSQEAKALMDAGAVVVDVRPQEKYNTAHIPGAVSLPISTLEQGIPAVIADAKAKPVVVYCGDGSTLGPRGTSLLNNAGFSRAVNLEQGLTGWKNAGFSVQ